MPCRDSDIVVHPVHYKVGQTLPRIDYKLTGLDLTALSVSVDVRRPDDTTFSLAPVMDDALFGVFHTDFDSTHLTVAGEYAFEVRVVDGADVTLSDTFALRVNETV